MSLFASWRLATKFATMLSIVLGFFFVFAATSLYFYTDDIAGRIVALIAQTPPEDLAARISQLIRSFNLRITAGMFGISIGIVIAVYIMFVIMIRRRLSYLADRFRDVSDGEGNLQQRIKVKGNDGLDAIGRLFNKFMEKLQAMISEIMQSMRSLNEVANHVTGIAGKSTEEAVQQQSRLEQVAAAMNEMAANAEKVADRAQSAAQKAGDAEHAAQQGTDVVQNTEHDIQALAEAISHANEVIRKLRMNSDEIGSILVVISDIAEQTNLLALNAAIEAARAGEQGRGFAVVAEEIRTLASRTQQSTNEIKNMIERLQEGTRDAVQAMESSQDRAQSGVEHSRITGQTLHTIAATISEINRMNMEISQAIAQQNQLARDIDMNISGINQSAQAAAEAARESLDESEKLADLATHLQTLLQQFKV